MVLIEQLNAKYKAQDEFWDFSLFPSWLEKKGIPNTKENPIVATTLEQTLLEFDLDTLPANHDTFDNLVLLKALINKDKLNKALMNYLGESVSVSLNNAINKYDADWNKLNRLQKIWQVITGKA